MNMNQPPPFVPIIQSGVDFIKYNKEHPVSGKVIYQYMGKEWVERAEMGDVILMDNISVMIVYYSKKQTRASLFMREFGLIASMFVDTRPGYLTPVHITPLGMLTGDINDFLKEEIEAALGVTELPEEALENDAILNTIVKQLDGNKEGGFTFDLTDKIPSIPSPKYDGEPID